MLDKSVIALKIRTYRVRHQWTQKEMAEYLKIDQSAVCKMETGVYRWTPLTVEKLKQKLPGLLDAA